jgi:hypothetical protein
MITAPEYGSGKSTVLRFIHQFAKDALPTVGLTPAALFRVADRYQITFLFDEVDRFFKNNFDDMAGLIDAGNVKATGFVLRNDPNAQTKDLDQVAFRTFGFKAFCGVQSKDIAKSITERSIVIEIRPKTRDQITKKITQFDKQIFQSCRDRMARFARDYGEMIQARTDDLSEKNELPRVLDSRGVDTWSVLFAIAGFIDEEQHNRALTEKLERICVMINSRSKTITDQRQLLIDLRAKLEEYQQMYSGTPTVTRAWLYEQLRADKSMIWGDYDGRHNGISTQKINGVLRAYDIESTRDRFYNPDTRKESKTDGWQVADLMQRLTEEINRGQNAGGADPEPTEDAQGMEIMTEEPWDQEIPPCSEEEPYEYPPEDEPF